MPMRRDEIVKLVLSVALCEAVGILGSVFTIPAIGGWYAQLVKPSFSPPNWLFGPVWTLLYALMGVSLFLVWRAEGKKKGVRYAVLVFGMQLVLNFLWSVAFFGLHFPLLGVIAIIALWVAIFLTILEFRNISTNASLLLIPYIVWVSFAALLNFYIFILN